MNDHWVPQKRTTCIFDKAEQAVSPTVIRGITSATDTLLDRVVGQLVVGTFFFAIGQMCDAGCIVTFDDKTVTIDYKPVSVPRVLYQELLPAIQ